MALGWLAPLVVVAGYWLALTTSGGDPLYCKQSNAGSSNTSGEQHRIAVSETPTDKKNCRDQSAQRDGDCQSWRQAEAAEDQACVARRQFFAGLFFGFWGLLGLAGTVVFTAQAATASQAAVGEARAATQAARDTITLTREIGHTQLRPYVHVKTVDLNRIFDNATRELLAIELYVVWANSGQSPTRRLNSGIDWRLFEGSTMPPDFDFPATGNERSAHHAAIGPQQDFRSVIILPTEALRSARARTHCLYYWAWIDYGETLNPEARYRTETCSRIDVYTDPGAEPVHMALTLHTTFNGADGDCVHKPKID